jgi:hypothetical protein
VGVDLGKGIASRLQRVTEQLTGDIWVFVSVMMSVALIDLKLAPHKALTSHRISTVHRACCH